MKKQILLAAFWAATATWSFAQSAVVKEGNNSMSLGSYNALSVELPGTETKEVEKAWDKFIDEYKGKTKKDKKSGEIFTDNATIKSWGNNTVDIYAKVTPSSAAKGALGNKLDVWFDLGGAYLSSSTHQDKYKYAEKMLQDFALSVSRTMIEEELKEQQKNLKKEEKTLTDLEKDKAGLEKDIESYKEKIKKAESDIEANIAKQKEQAAAIEKQKAVVSEVQKKLDSLK